ncbi:MAG: type I secretion C-terminal target domain-containing protein, partial [Pseudomonadales bacterium]|nr:type I secretion C-terminal target domain-containing protein [Pseudomonadales bacterium]
ADGITPTDFTVASDGSNGTATIDASTGAWTYTPNANFNGDDSFTVTVTDDDGNTETQVIEVTVEPTDSVTSQSIVIDGSEINAVPSSTVVIGRNDADDDDDVIIDNLIGPDVVITDESGQHVKFKNGVVGTKGDGDLLTNGDSLRFSYYDDVDLSLTSDGKFANYSADSTSSTNNAQAELRVDGDSSARASLSITALAADGTTIAIDSVQVTYADGSSEVLTVADTNFSSNGSGVVTITDLPDGVTIAVHGVSNYASLDFENESGTKFGFVYGTDAEDAKASDGSDDAVYAPDVGIGYVISTDGHKVKVKNGLIGVKDTGNIKDESIDPGENLTIDFQTGIETDRGDDGKLDSYTAGTDVAINHASFRLLAEGSTDITINLTDASNAAVSVAYVLVTHDGTTYRLTASNGAADPVVIGGQNVTFSESSGVVTLNNLPDDVTVQVAGDSDYSAIDLSNAGTGTNQFAIADIDTGSDSFATASGQFATLATGSFSDWTETGAVTSRAGEALTVNGEALSYVSEGEKLLAVTSSGVVAFEVSLQEVNGVTGYSVEMYRSLDPSFTDISSSNSVSPSNSASKTISFSNSSLQITVTATTNGQATTINGQNNPAKYGPGNDKEVNTNDALIFTASSSISGLDLSLFNFSGTDTLIWTAYDGATVVASGTVVPSDLSNSNLEINAGVPFTSLSITAGSGDFQIVDDGIVAQEVNETPLTIDLQATVDGNPANFSITFDQLAAGDTTMQAVDPDSLLLAGAGSETLIGLTGEADTFEWNLADGTTEGDTIQGFEEGSDVIDLSDLLTGYDPADPNNDDLADFIQVAYDSATGDTTIEVSSNGDGTINQVIKVEGVDLTDDVSLTGLSGNDSINAILSDMMTKGTLIDPDI